ncbi:MAG TPA: glycoside hydrolase family 2 [Bacteroidetes bacterium]|nr:glycoside hydrolase family 2 [Bacteroidota bacterium]
MRHIKSVFAIFSILFFQFPNAQAQLKWQPLGSHLSTPWTAKVSPENALPEYPRPQMVRSKWLNLNGEWGFQLMDKKTEAVGKKGKILVPFPVESALSGIRQKVAPGDLMVYNRSFELPQKWTGQRILLHFGAVAREAKVFVNNKETGTHKGAYDPFTFDITAYLKPAGQQHITVQASNPAGEGNPRPASGIWQTVWLEAVPKTYIKSYRAEPDADKNRVLVRVVTAGENKSSAVVVARIFENGKKLSEARGRSGTPLMMNIRSKAHYWSPGDPFLYDLEISIANKNGDKIKGYFGLRKISTGAGASGTARLLLNNEPLFQNGLLDHGLYPDGGCTPPTEAAMQYDLKMAKEMGFNLIRKTGIAPARWYYLCDKTGLLVWQDMPAAANRSKEEQRQFKWELKAMVDHLFSHPSIVAWAPFGSGKGQHDLGFYIKKLKQWDPLRLVIAPAGSIENRSADLLDARSFPAPFLPQSENGKPLILGGFGGLGLGVRGHQWPGSDWNYLPVEAPENLLAGYEELRRQLLPLIENGLSAAVYVQLSDSPTENDGLLTYDRKLTKIDPSLVAAANQGYLPPKPLSDARIFIKKRNVKLATPKPGASITYTFDGPGPNAVWKPYKEALRLRKNTTLRCRAEWPDGKKSQVRDYVFTKTKPIRNPNGSSGKSSGASPNASSSHPGASPVPQSGTSPNAAPEKILGASPNHPLTAWLDVPKTAVYTFHLTTAADTRLSVSNQILIENNNLRSEQEKHGSIALKKGKHPVQLFFLNKKNGGDADVWAVGEDGQRVEVGLR